ncbi:MAG: RDD family protein, partial [Terriglobales bacterium]
PTTPGVVQTPVAPPSSTSSYSASASPYQAVAPAVGVGYGGFWIRVVALIIDGIIVRVVIAPVGMIFGGLGLAGGMMGGFPHRGLAILGGGVTFILLVFGSWLYEAFMESSSYQATLGKMIFGMKVTDLNGNRISFERATGRHFAKWLSGMILFIGYIMVGLTERKQGLHDLLAGTLVRRA